MAITINIYYEGKNGNAVKFAKEMISSGTVDGWQDQNALDIHHASPIMARIAALREKYDLHMRVERYVSDDDAPQSDAVFIRK